MEEAVTSPEAYSLLHQGAVTLAGMEHNGIKVDLDYLDQAIEDTKKSIEDLKRKLQEDPVFTRWKRRFGLKTNITSMPQLGEVIFGILGYESKYRTATGKPSTDESAFEHVDLPFVKEHIRLRKLIKLKSTFLEGLKRETVDGLFHPTFNLHTVTTFRSSSGRDKAEDKASRDLNFQNLPIRNKGYSKAIRKCFIPRRGRVLCEVDYGALEFRGAACFWKDPLMVEYANNLDVHQDCSAECYLLDRSQVSKDTRSLGKSKFVFPILYGSYYLKCARDLWEAIGDFSLRIKDTEVGLKEHLAGKGIKSLGACDPRMKPRPGTFEYHIQKVERWFNDKFPVFSASKEKWWQDYLRRGWFRMMTGFVIRGVYSRNYLLNSPVQGPCFHCLLWSLTEIQKEIDRRKMKSLLLAQIHDCIIGDVPHNEVQDFLHLAKEVMTERIRKHWGWVITTMVVEVDVVEEGSSWYEKKPYIEEGGIWKPKPK